MKSGCALDNRLTCGAIEQLWVSCVLKTWGIFLQGCTLVQTAEGNILQVVILHLRSWENKRVVRQSVFSTENCRKCTMQKFTSSQIPFFRMGKGAMNEPEIKVHQKMESLSRAIQGICKENWWRKDSVRMPHTFLVQKDERDRASR